MTAAWGDGTPLAAFSVAFFSRRQALGFTPQTFLPRRCRSSDMWARRSWPHLRKDGRERAAHPQDRASSALAIGQR